MRDYLQTAAFAEEMGIDLTAEWEEDQHPRDDLGRFAQSAISGDAERRKHIGPGLESGWSTEGEATRALVIKAYPVERVAERIRPRFQDWCKESDIGPCGAVSVAVQRMLVKAGLDARVMSFEIDDGVTEYGSPHYAVAVFRPGQDAPAALVDLSSQQFDEHLPALVLPGTDAWDRYRNPQQEDVDEMLSHSPGSLWSEEDVKLWTARLGA